MNRYMQKAIEEAREGIQNNHGGPFGCIIVKDDVIVGRGHNMVVAHNDPTAHGEIQAIRNACEVLHTFDLTGCELYTTSEPCPMCKCAIMWANIKKVYYGCTVKDAENIGFRDVLFATQSPESEELGRAECLELFEKYQSLEHTSY